MTNEDFCVKCVGREMAPYSAAMIIGMTLQKIGGFTSELALLLGLMSLVMLVVSDVH